MKIGILREGKQVPDKRVPFSPVQCSQIQNLFKGVKVVVQSSKDRCFADQEYRDYGIEVSEDVSDCDILMGIKEVPEQWLIAGKHYLFFSHTIKQQPHNRKLLKAASRHNITLIDYECLTDRQFNRIIGFGHYAGIVGTYNGLMGYGKRYGFYDLKPANLCHDRHELMNELKKMRLPNIKIIVTGNGRVANGAIEMLGLMGIRRITAYEFLSFSYREPTYAQLHSNNYNEAIDGSGWSTERFYKHPTDFHSTFAKFSPHCDLLIHCSYWDPRAPHLFSREEMRSKDFRISVIADITCDINGSIPSTTKASSIENKFYGYNPLTEELGEPFSRDNITVMAVDNLPCELPRDSSEDFGKELIDKVLPALLGDDGDELIHRASILKGGKLTERFAYLKDYLEG